MIYQMLVHPMGQNEEGRKMQIAEMGEMGCDF